MDTAYVHRWMREHPRSIHGASETVISRCAAAVHRSATRDAWLRAREIVDREHDRWVGTHGNHASPGFVAHEICIELARKLSHMEPAVPEGNEERFLDDETRAMLEPDATDAIRPWLHAQVVRAEHDAWRDIVKFTRKRGHSIPEEEHLSFDTTWEKTCEYGEAAAMVTDMLLRDYAKRIH